VNLSPLPLAVFVVDATGTITSWNRACEKLAGYGAADINMARTVTRLRYHVFSSDVTLMHNQPVLRRNT
jgi:PAS domain S-box-containing protein